MERFAILFGVLLCGLGLIGYFAPTTVGAVGDNGTSPTALIPAVFGVALMICGLIVSTRPATRKHVMHIAAAVGLLGAIGGIMPLVRSDFDFSKASAVSGLLMIVLCCIFVGICVLSFVAARAAKLQGLPQPQPNRCTCFDCRLSLARPVLPSRRPRHVRRSCLSPGHSIQSARRRAATHLRRLAGRARGRALGP